MRLESIINVYITFKIPFLFFMEFVDHKKYHLIVKIFIKKISIRYKLREVVFFSICYGYNSGVRHIVVSKFIV